MAKGNAGPTKLVNVFARLISNIVGPVSVVPKKVNHQYWCHYENERF